MHRRPQAWQLILGILIASLPLAAARPGAATQTEFADGFESYAVGSYPATGGWYNLWSGLGYGTEVTDLAAHSGAKSFVLDGHDYWVRADGLDIDPAASAGLSYEFSVMIPGWMGGGAEIGFFVLTGPAESWDFNSFHFVPDGRILVRGTGSQIGDPETTTTLTETWLPDQWYTCRADIDFEAGTVDFWLDGELVATDIPAAPRDRSTIFSLGTYYGAGGRAFFDDISLTWGVSTCRGETATIVGTLGPDLLEGTAGRDVIAGLGGDDVITGLSGNDRICGGAGNDTIDGGGGRDRLFGDEGNDALNGAGGDDILQGGDGDDTLVPGPGDDTLNGGPGTDTVDYRRAPLAATVDLAAGTAVADGTDTLRALENVDGSRHADIIHGSRGPDVLRGLGGDDVLVGREGNDRLDGGGGADTARGGPGRDTCYAETRSACEWPVAWRLWQNGLGPTRFGHAEAAVRAAMGGVFGKPWWESGSEWDPCIQDQVRWQNNSASVEAQFLDGVFVGYSFATIPPGSTAPSLSTPEGIRIGDRGARVAAAYPGATLVHDYELGWKYEHGSYEFWLDWTAASDPLGAKVRWITVGQFCIPI